MFERLAIPTPFQVGPVNTYLAGRTVVDPGPESEDALAALTEGLAANDLALDDVEQVLITHPHPDHFGLASHLRDHGADVLTSPASAGILRDFEGHLDYEQSYFSALFEAHGMAPETTQTVTQLPEAFVEYAPSTAVDRELADGDVVTIEDVGATGGTERQATDVDVTVRELVGHSEVELAFEWEEFGGAAAASGEDGGESNETASTGSEFTAIVGDHVLPDTTPNPFLQPPPRDGDATAVPEHDGLADLDDLRSRQLPAFNESLERLRAAGHDRLLPGHGEPIADPPSRIDEILQRHEERTDEVLEIVDDATTAVEVMRGLFPDLAVIDYFPGMSEALGHLDVLVERGEIVREERDGQLVFRAV
ncbi:MBL fold metallo-hydrolase [Salinarchaeum chitinilyticum]